MRSTWHATSGLPPEVLAHGFAGQEDLPVPFAFAAYGAALAVAASFVLVDVLWRAPRYRDDEGGVQVPWVERLATSRVFRAALAGLAALLAAVVLVRAGRDPNLFGSLMGWVLVVLWLGLLPASLLFGPIWRVINPLRVVHHGLSVLQGRDPRDGRRTMPASWGYWPAAFGLIAFAWLELVADTTHVLFVWWLALYAVVHLAAAQVFGARWLDRADAFEAASRSWGSLSPWRWRREAGGAGRRLVFGSPLRTAAATRPAAGVAGVVLVLFGVTVYDSLRAASWVTNITFNLSVWFPETVVKTGFLVYVLTTVGLLYVGALWLADKIAGGRRRPEAGKVAPLTREFAHTLLPIAAAYFVAHYLVVLVLAWVPNVLALAGPDAAARWPLQAEALSVTVVGLLQVGVVVLGHVLSVVLAHDRALRVFPRRDAVLSQLPLLALMVSYTTVGLFLLFTGTPSGS